MFMLIRAAGIEDAKQKARSMGACTHMSFKGVRWLENGAMMTLEWKDI